MSKAVRFDHYGEIDVLQVVEVSQPKPKTGQVLVKVKAAGINPGETAIRQGIFDKIYPTTFPSGQGSDFAGTIAEIGDGAADFAVDEEVRRSNRIHQRSREPIRIRRG